jgi:hypothetical protein
MSGLPISAITPPSMLSTYHQSHAARARPEQSRPVFSWGFDIHVLTLLTLSTVSDYGLDGRGSIPDRGKGFFL